MVAIIIMILISKLTIIDIVDRKRYFIVWMFCDDYVTNVRKSLASSEKIVFKVFFSDADTLPSMVAVVASRASVVSSN